MATLKQTVLWTNALEPDWRGYTEMKGIGYTEHGLESLRQGKEEDLSLTNARRHLENDDCRTGRTVWLVQAHKRPGAPSTLWPTYRKGQQGGPDITLHSHLFHHKMPLTTSETHIREKGDYHLLEAPGSAGKENTMHMNPAGKQPCNKTLLFSHASNFVMRK